MIVLEHLSRRFEVGGQEIKALDEVSLSIDGGDYVSVMGPSGSGKSTLLHIIGLLDRPSSGRYLLEGEDVTTLNDNTLSRLRREKMGFVFQFFHLVPRLTAAENVELPLILAGIPPRERRERVQHLLDELGLGKRAQHRPSELSGGQRQRVAIARATVMEPAVILADEPTGNLDRTSGYEVLDILEALNARGMGLIVVTHDPEIGKRSRRHIHMVDGRIGLEESS
ncbi:ABC transporter related protein [Nitrosococcus halophilus Nc 4]|uniref:ABC transporter related protein n=1 Tax=Nitrosococcus halophilus (strain Nc4) TaxID=472759 RepID=D5C0R9_NITHN|nr:ABC transporter ATP-binding protein [Nitrosococcus halophilus]ADE16392.1 ABC transporter related protein [Nitrosococcus halophilus Nc 4]